MNKTINIVLLILLLVGLVAFTAYSIKEILDLKSNNSSLESKTSKNNEDIKSMNRIAFSLPYEAYNLRRLSFDSSLDKLYMPELKIRVPYSSNARSLLYTLRSDEAGNETNEVDVVTDKLIPTQEETTLDCTTILRLKIEDEQNPYSPAEKATSFKLKNGKTLQVYAFSGGQEGNNKCKKLYEQQDINSQNFAKSFNGVESY